MHQKSQYAVHILFSNNFKMQRDRNIEKLWLKCSFIQYGVEEGHSFPCSLIVCLFHGTRGGRGVREVWPCRGPAHSLPVADLHIDCETRGGMSPPLYPPHGLGYILPRDALSLYPPSAALFVANNILLQSSSYPPLFLSLSFPFSCSS